jgi:NADH:ubiquinone oxidoreductase subunit C
MIDIQEILAETTFKFKSREKALYDDLRDNEPTKVFNSISDTLLCAFTVGYHFDKKTETSKGNAIVNLSSIPADTKRLMVELILLRHPDLETANEIWKVAEEYAEWGIEVLHDSVKSNGYHLFIDDVLGK